MSIQKQADILYTFRTYKIGIVLLAIVIFINFFVGCDSKQVSLSEIQNEKIVNVVRGLIEADIVFPFEDVKDIPLEFYPEYLSIRYDYSGLSLDDEMRVNINCDQAESVIKSDWDIEEIQVNGIADDENSFFITLQAGLQGKEHLINSKNIAKDLVVVNVSIHRTLDTINQDINSTRLYMHTIDYKFKCSGDDVKLMSASL